MARRAPSKNTPTQKSAQAVQEQMTTAAGSGADPNSAPTPAPSVGQAQEAVASPLPDADATGSAATSDAAEPPNMPADAPAPETAGAGPAADAAAQVADETETTSETPQTPPSDATSTAAVSEGKGAAMPTQALHDGETIRRAIWGAAIGVVMSVPRNQTKPIFLKIGKRAGPQPWMPSVEDLAATDWEVVSQSEAAE